MIIIILVVTNSGHWSLFSKRNGMNNIRICAYAKVADIMHSIRRKKWRWAGHLARTSDNRWTKRVTEWKPWLGSRHRGRQKLRWSDELTKFIGIKWIATAHDHDDRHLWHQLGEVFALQWAEAWLMMMMYASKPG